MKIQVFNKRTLCVEESVHVLFLCVEESVHVLFDESNSLSEKDVQDEDFELGLCKKDCLANQEQGKDLQERSGAGPDSNADQQASDQTGGTAAEPCLQQRSEISESGTSTGTETGPVTVSEPGSPNS